MSSNRNPSFVTESRIVGHVPLVRRIDQDVAGWRDDEKRREALHADVIEIAHDPVRWELRVLLCGRPDIAREQLLHCPHMRRLRRRHERRNQHGDGDGEELGTRRKRLMANPPLG